MMGACEWPTSTEQRTSTKDPVRATAAITSGSRAGHERATTELQTDETPIGLRLPIGVFDVSSHCFDGDVSLSWMLASSGRRRSSQSLVHIAALFRPMRSRAVSHGVGTTAPSSPYSHPPRSRLGAPHPLHPTAFAARRQLWRRVRARAWGWFRDPGDARADARRAPPRGSPLAHGGDAGRSTRRRRLRDLVLGARPTVPARSTEHRLPTDRPRSVVLGAPYRVAPRCAGGPGGAANVRARALGRAVAGWSGRGRAANPSLFVDGIGCGALGQLRSGPAEASSDPIGVPFSVAGARDAAPPTRSNRALGRRSA